MKSPLQALFLALVLAALGQACWQHPRLPEKVAVHFGASGRADAWGSRRAQTAFHLGTVLFLALVIEGAAFVPARLPVKLINLPNRAYWFAPERATTTRSRLVNASLAIGCALMAFFLALFHLVYRANLEPAPHLASTVWWLLGGLVVVVFAQLAHLVSHFGRKPAA